jgi:hypothetical protein
MTYFVSLYVILCCIKHGNYLVYYERLTKHSEQQDGAGNGHSLFQGT